METENALKEVSSTKKQVFKLVGGLLVEKSAVGVKKELTAAKKDLDLRIESIEKQEEKTHKKVNELQEVLSKELKTGK